MDSIRKGIFFSIIGTVLFATKGIFVKLAYQYEVDSITLLLLRMVFSLPFYLISLFVFRKSLIPFSSWRRKWIIVLVATALLGYYLSSLFDFIGLQYVDASVERLILYIFPSIVVLLSFVFFGEKILTRTLIILGITYSGLFLIFVPELSNISMANEFWKGSAFVLLTAFTFALFYLGNQYLIPKISAIQFTNLSMIIACMAVIIHYGLFHSEGDAGLFEQPWQVYGYGLAMAFISTVIPSYFVSYSIKYIGASNSSIISSFGPIATIILAYFFLGERLGLTQIIGGLLIILSISLLRKSMRSTK